jgi:hypothetical protein
MKICFNGCSFTVGEGFLEHNRDEYVYDRLTCNKLGAERKNIAVEGSSNLLIFQRSANEIINGDSNIVFSQWSALNRLWLFPGPDCCISLKDEKDKNFSYRNIYIDKKKLNDLKDVFLILNHDYQNILDLCLYVNVLDNLGKLYNKKVYHINGLVPWTDDLIDYNSEDLFNSISEYTREILDFGSRDDCELIIFFDKLQTEVQKLNRSNWVNMFQSWQQNTLDVGPLGHHPGIQSHQWMADKIINFLENKT